MKSLQIIAMSIFLGNATKEPEQPKVCYRIHQWVGRYSNAAITCRELGVGPNSHWLKDCESDYGVLSRHIDVIRFPVNIFEVECPR